MEKAFRQHKANGVLLNFPNGNNVSSIWSTGSYTENHDLKFFKDGGLDLKKMYEEPNGGSMTVEVMVDCGEELNRALQEKYESSAGGSVIGHLSIMEWLEVINRVANEKTLKTKQINY